MARKTRKASRSSGNGLFSTIWSPFKHIFMASGESAHKIGKTAGKIVNESMKGVEGVGSSFARHTNQAISKVGSGVGRGVSGIGKGVKRIGKGVKNAVTMRKSRK